MIAVQLPKDAARARYALGALLGLLRLEWREAEPGETADLAYGEGAARCRIPAGPQDGWDDPEPRLVRRDGLAILYRGECSDRLATSPTELGYDVLYASYAALTGVWERTDPVDDVGCPLAGQGWLARNGLLDDPFVHHYAAALGELLRHVGIDSSTETRASIVLTHDVDNNFAHLFGQRERWELLRRDLRARRPTALRRSAGLARHAVHRRHDPNDRFADWADWHGGWRSRPTYFAASFGLFGATADSRDVPYDVSHPQVAATLREALDDGAELGIHFSLAARSSSDRMRSEREALEHVLGAPVRSARHHWWALGIPAEQTLRLHAGAGIEVDCSLGFNDRPGFRRGIAAAFRPFDHERQGPAPVWALPTMAMDAGLFTDPTDGGRPVDDLRALYRSVRDVGGALVLDWHVHAANPRRLHGAGEGLRTFMAEAVEDGARLCTPLELVRQ